MKEERRIKRRPLFNIESLQTRNSRKKKLTPRVSISEDLRQFESREKDKKQKTLCNSETVNIRSSREKHILGVSVYVKTRDRLRAERAERETERKITRRRDNSREIKITRVKSTSLACFTL